MHWSVRTEAALQIFTMLKFLLNQWIISFCQTSGANICLKLQLQYFG